MAENTNSHEVMKQCFENEHCEMSKINGVINKMSKDDIRVHLGLVGLSERGVKEVLKKRLKNHYKKLKLTKDIQQSSVSWPSSSLACRYVVDSYCIIDFEATCEEVNAENYVHEIIEFPAVLLDAKSLQIIDEFHEYCKPIHKPTLSTFCKNLTGIRQENVDSAENFATVLHNFDNWLKSHKLGAENTFAIVTDGPWDLAKFLPKQCHVSNIPVPKYATKWINLRKHFTRYYKRIYETDRPLTLESMIEALGLSFEGRPHSGLHDSRNITRMMIRMIDDGFEPRINDSIDNKTYKF